MASNQYIIQIPEPCEEDWQRMLPDQQGRFCEHCAKTVIDFTTLSDEEIIHIIEQQKGKLCGRLTASQLNRVLEISDTPVYQRNKLKELIAALFLLLASKEVAANKPKQEKIVAIQPSNNYKAEKRNTDNKDSVCMKQLTGVVYAKDDGAPLEGAIILNNTRHQGVTADSSGRFKIATSIGDSLTVKYIGLKSLSFVVNSMEVKDYRLVMEDVVLGNMPIIYVSKGGRIRNRIRYFFRTGRIYKKNGG